MAFTSFRAHHNADVANTRYSEGFIHARNHIRVPPKDNQQYYLYELNDFSADSCNPRHGLKPLGLPTAKKRLHNSHVVAAVLSLTCLALAIMAVANEKVSWLLGRK